MFKSIKAFLVKWRKLSFLVLTVVFLVSCIAIVVSDLKILAAIPFGFSIICFIRLITYKHGHIPFFSVDRTYQSMKPKYHDEDELDEKFKEKSIDNATSYFIVVIFSFPVWIIAEILYLI